MNIFYSLSILILILTSLNGVAVPPTAHVKTAFIDISQGKRIYANGYMQAVVKVYVEFYPGIDWYPESDLHFYEFGTGTPLEDLGWEVSKVDNGYDHNIGSLSALSISSQDENVESKYKIVTRYISTKNKNERIHICFGLTSHDTNLNEKEFSTCYRQGIERGTATVFAQRPDNYYSIDFEISEKKPVFKIPSDDPKEKFDVIGYVRHIQPRSYFPRTVRFRIKNTEKVIPIDNVKVTNIIADSELAITRFYDLFTSVYPFGYMESYLFNITGNSKVTKTKSLEFYYINLNKPLSLQYEHVFQNGDNNIANILTIEYYRSSGNIGHERCTHENEVWFNCKSYDPSTGTIVTTHRKDSDVTLKGSNVYTLRLIDNYGNHFDLVFNDFPDPPEPKKE